jgi:succinoglycan biosynthesis protein ExoA
VEPWPAVSVVIPAREAETSLPGSVEAVLSQDYPGALEVVIAVAPSADRTGRIAAQLAMDNARVLVVQNPSGGTSAGLNAAIAASTGPVVTRVDAHSWLYPDYLRKAVTLLAQTGADTVGGIQQAEGLTDFERATAAAMTSRIGAGDARFRCGGPPGPVDTVYLGVFRRMALERVGGFDETLQRNQDYELNWRLRSAGGTVYFHPDLRVRYRPRSSFRALAQQYYDYGRWKREMLRRHPRALRWRQLAPPLAVIANVAGLALALTGRLAGLAVPATYAAGTTLAAVPAARRLDLQAALRLPAVLATMHHAWGLGFLRGVQSDEDPFDLIPSYGCGKSLAR